MNSNEYIVDELEKNAMVLHSLLLSATPIEQLYKPAPDKWCLLEIVCHLYDEEREDFRARLKHILEKNPEEFPAIDPAGWVISRSYLQQNYEEKLQQFLDERVTSIHWLRQLDHPDWSLYYEHPRFGKMSAKLFLSNWLAHDYHHIRQIVSVKHAWLKNESDEPLTYAGDW